MQKYKNITISKISDHGGEEKTPTHAIVATNDQYQQKKTVGKLWTRKGEMGKFLSGTMSSEYKSPADGKVFDGYVVVSETELNELIEKASRAPVLTKEESEAYHNRYQQPDAGVQKANEKTAEQLFNGPLSAEDEEALANMPF